MRGRRGWGGAPGCLRRAVCDRPHTESTVGVGGVIEEEGHS